MDPNDQNQYHNLSQTFQHLALSPPQPLSPHPPNGPSSEHQQQQHYVQAQQGSNDPVYGAAANSHRSHPRGTFDDSLVSPPSSMPAPGSMGRAAGANWGSVGPGGTMSSLMSNGKVRSGRSGLPSQWLEPNQGPMSVYPPHPAQMQQQQHHQSFSQQQQHSHQRSDSPSRSISPPPAISTSGSPPLDHAMFNPYAIYSDHHSTTNRTSNAPRYGGFANGLAGLGASGGGGAWGSPMLAGLGGGAAGAGPFAMGPGVGGGMDDDVIPTAIVIKNINFNLQKEDLLRTIESLGAPLPYAFNYHMDQGVFRGLAFANFRSPLEADAVVAALNGYDVGGRKLRVEYKKVLQAGEKERIEREKALRRMRSIQAIPPHDNQQNQQAPPPMPPLPQQQQQQQQGQRDAPGGPIRGEQRERDDSYPGIQPVSLGLGLGANLGGAEPMGRDSSGSSGVERSNSIPIVQVTPQREREGSFSGYEPGPGSDSGSGIKSSKSTELDLNDATTLDIYSRVLVFKEDRMRDELAFSRTLTALQRRVVHLVAQKLGVYHYSVGEGEERYAVVTRSEGRGDRQTLRHHASRPNLPSNQQGNNPLQKNQNLYASSPSLRNKSSMPDLSHLHGPTVSRDPSRSLAPQRSNGNLRDGYATIGSSGSARRAQTIGPQGAVGGDYGGFQNTLFGDSLSPSHVPAAVVGASDSTDSLVSSNAPSNTSGSNGPASVNTNTAGTLRQPRGPPGDARGFSARRFVVPAAPGSAISNGGSVSPVRGVSPSVEQAQRTSWHGDEDFATSHEALEV